MPDPTHKPKRCRAHSRSGEQCKNPPVTGAVVCRMHGGSSPQVKQKAQVRAAKEAAEAEARRMVQRAGVDVDPIDHLLDSLALAYQLVKVWGTMVADLDERASDGAALVVVDRKGEARAHPFVVDYQAALDRRAKFAKLCIDAGVAQRHVELHERQVELAHRAFEAMLDDLGLSGEKRQEARRSYASHLRLVS